MHIRIILLLSASITFGICNADESQANLKKIVCFWSGRVQNLSLQDVDPSLCTHLVYDGIFWANVLHGTPNASLEEFASLKNKNRNLKTLVKFEGSHFKFENYEDYPYKLKTSKRNKFLKNVTTYLRRYNIDGLDLHWTFPVVKMLNPKEDYLQLIQEFRKTFENEAETSQKEPLLLSISLPHATEYIKKNCDFPQLNKYVDIISLESYDYHYYGENVTNHHAPLFALNETSTDPSDSRLNVNHTVQFCIENGVDRQKLLLGIPVYGRCFKVATTKVDLKNPVKPTGFAECDMMTFSEICKNVRHSRKDFEEYKNYEKIMGPFAYSASESKWVGYDDVDSVKMKVRYALKNELGGIMFSSMNMDDFAGSCYNEKFPLIHAGRAALLQH